MKTLLLSLLLFPFIATAQELSAEGTSGSVDKKRRAPVVSVNPVHDPDQVRLLADAYVPDDTFKGSPIQFDFYVNRKLITTQLRSVEQPGPVGAHIGRDIATPPFNFSVVATVLHTNRQFVTVAQGTVFAQNLAATFSCVLNESLTDGTTGDFTNDSVPVTQTGTSGIAFDFKAADESGESDRQVQGSFEISSSDKTISGNLTVDKRSPLLVTGSAAFTGESIENFTAETAVTEGTNYNLECTNSEESIALGTSGGLESEGDTGANVETGITSTELTNSGEMSPEEVNKAIEALINGK